MTVPCRHCGETVRGGMRLPLIAASLALVAGALAAGGCSATKDGPVAASQTRAIATTEWVSRVDQICEWVRPQSRRLMRAASGLRTFDEAAAWVRAVTELSERANAVFRRLPPPRDRRRERQEILRLMRREDDFGSRLVRAIEEQRSRAFFTFARRIEAIDRRIAIALDDVGATECNPGMREKPLSERTLTA